MSAAIAQALSWHTLVFLLIVYGFMPGFVLRFLVKIYPKGDPRRSELVGELYSMSRWARPFWVVEQFETVLHEGLPTRLRALAPRLRSLFRASHMPYMGIGIAIATVAFLVSDGAFGGQFDQKSIWASMAAIGLSVAVVVGAAAVIRECLRGIKVIRRRAVLDAWEQLVVEMRAIFTREVGVTVNMLVSPYAMSLMLLETGGLKEPWPEVGRPIPDVIAEVQDVARRAMDRSRITRREQVSCETTIGTVLERLGRSA